MNIEILKKTCNIILFGSVGHGKTTLINKITNSDFKTSSTGFSCTQEIQYANSVIGDNIIIDFPGLNSTVEIMKHLNIQKNVLSVIPFRMICFVVKWSFRYDDMIKNIVQMLKIFYNHIENITIIITNTDNVSMKETADFEYVITEKYKIKNILFTNINDRPKQILDKLEKIKKDMNNQLNIIIQTKELYQTVESDFNLDIITIRQKYIKTFIDMLGQYKVYFNNNLKDKELIRTLYFSIKDYKDKLLNDYGNNIKKILQDQPLYHVELIMFQNEIYGDFNKYRLLISQNLEIQVAKYNNELNRYKKCPCGLTWFKVYGCDIIKCGKRSISKDTFFFGKYLNYKIEILNGMLIIEKKRNIFREYI